MGGAASVAAPLLRVRRAARGWPAVGQPPNDGVPAALDGRLLALRALTLRSSSAWRPLPAGCGTLPGAHCDGRRVARFWAGGGCAAERARHRMLISPAPPAWIARRGHLNAAAVQDVAPLLHRAPTPSTLASCSPLCARASRGALLFPAPTPLQSSSPRYEERDLLVAHGGRTRVQGAVADAVPARTAPSPPQSDRRVSNSRPLAPRRCVLREPRSSVALDSATTLHPTSTQRRPGSRRRTHSRRHARRPRSSLHSHSQNSSPCPRSGLGAPRAPCRGEAPRAGHPPVCRRRIAGRRGRASEADAGSRALPYHPMFPGE